MPIPLGIFATAGASAAAGPAFEQIATAFGTGSSATITFSSIPSTYKHLQIRAVYQVTPLNDGYNSFLQFNGDTGSNYAGHVLYGNGSSVANAAFTTQTTIRFGQLTGSNANFHSVSIMDILDYSSTSKNTTTRTLNGSLGGSFPQIALFSGLWNNTSAVSSISITNANSWTTSSRFSLYGIKG